MAQKTFADKAYVNTELAKKANKEHGTHLTLGTGSGNAYRGDYGNTAYQHSQAAHAPSNAQKNSDITKAEIEAKLTGVITTHKHSLLESNDTRAKNDLPSTYTNRGIIPEFKSSATIGLPEVGKGFTGLITYQQWSDTSAWSGGKATQFGTIDDGRMYYRKGDGSGWGTWYQFYTTQNKPTPADIGAAVANHGNHVPTPQAAQNTTFLRNDNTWHKLTLSDLGAAAASHGTHVTYGTTNPLVAGTASPGSAATVSRSDHIHPAQTSVSGNAGSATKLASSRTLTIGDKGKGFDGSANVSWSTSEMGVAKGNYISATTAATAQWYRIATSAVDQVNNLAIFNICGNVGSYHSNITLVAGVTYGKNPTLIQLGYTNFGNGITKARIVYHTTYSGSYAYLELYLSQAKATVISVDMIGKNGWTLVAPSTVGSIPSGYTNKEITLTLDKIVANIQGNVSGSSGSCTGNAATATKATKDSAGQQINTTYIKGLSVSGRTITYTKGDGTTGTITTQDNNTTYTANTGIKLNGTTFQHTNAVTAGTAQGDANKTLSWGGTFTIPTVTYDAQGHITGKGTTTMTMPGNPNTDTHHTAKNIVGASATATANATATNGNVYLNLIENNAVRSKHKIAGTGATTVTSDSSGNITINSTNTTYGVATTSANGLMSSAMVTKLNGIAEGANKYTHPNSGATAGSYGPSANASPTHSGTFTVPYLTINAAGHITAVSNKTITLPADNNTDTKVTNTVNTTTKYYVTGSSSASTNTGTQIFDTNVYVDATAGKFVATTMAVNNKVQMQYNSTSESLDFIFI